MTNTHIPLSELVDYYGALGSRIMLWGMSDKQLQTFAKYRPGKSFQDVKDLIKESRHTGSLFGSMEIEAGHMTTKLPEIVEIDTTQDLRDYKERLFKLEFLV